MKTKIAKMQTKESSHSPRTIKVQKNLDHKTLTNIFSLLFENSVVKLFSIFAYNFISPKIIKAVYNRKKINKNCQPEPI